MVSKEDFICTYASKITVWFNLYQFKEDDNFIVRKGEVKLGEAGNYYCPWYYDVETGKEYKVGFEKILEDPQAKAVKIKEAGSIIGSKKAKIRQYIKDFKGKTEESLCPFLIATDEKANKSLVLDGNNTLAALYMSWSKDKMIPVLEIRGANLIKVFPDFCVVYRS